SARISFLASKVGMYFDSSAGVSNVVNEASFEVGTAPLPVPNGTEPHGSIVGGNSNYITKEIPEEQKNAAWEFLKYTASPEVQAKWAAGTGYIPVAKDSY